jgi:hypothetical protein
MMMKPDWERTLVATIEFDLLVAFETHSVKKIRTTCFDVTPISYAQLGLLRQVHRRETDIYANIRRLLQASGRRLRLVSGSIVYTGRSQFTTLTPASVRVAPANGCAPTARIVRRTPCAPPIPMARDRSELRDRRSRLSTGGWWSHD